MEAVLAAVGLLGGLQIFILKELMSMRRELTAHVSKWGGLDGD